MQIHREISIQKFRRYVREGGLKSLTAETKQLMAQAKRIGQFS